MTAANHVKCQEEILTDLLLDLYGGNSELLRTIRLHPELKAIETDVPSPIVSRAELFGAVARAVLQRGFTPVLLDAIKVDQPLRDTSIQQISASLVLSVPPFVTRVGQVKRSSRRYAIGVASVAMGVGLLALQPWQRTNGDSDGTTFDRGEIAVARASFVDAPHEEVSKTRTCTPVSTQPVICEEADDTNQILQCDAPLSELNAPASIARRYRRGAKPHAQDSEIRINVVSVKDGKNLEHTVSSKQSAEEAAKDAFIKLLGAPPEAEEYFDDEEFGMCDSKMEKCYQAVPVDNIFNDGDNVYLQRGGRFQNDPSQGGLVAPPLGVKEGQ